MRTAIFVKREDEKQRDCRKGREEMELSGERRKVEERRMRRPTMAESMTKKRANSFSGKGRKRGRDRK